MAAAKLSEGRVGSPTRVRFGICTFGISDGINGFKLLLVRRGMSFVSRNPYGVRPS